MARKDQLRSQRKGTVINVTSTKQESSLIKAIQKVEKNIYKRFGKDISVGYKKQWHLKDIVSMLKKAYPDVKFHYHFETSSIRPDGGVLYLEKKGDNNTIYPILIAEVKNQGTNDARAKEGLKKQARGNAIERLGKNVIGLRVALKRESIFPFVCFGYGCDFEPESYILDRVSTIAMFGRINSTYLHDEGDGLFDRGSFYFREKEWSVAEMTRIMTDIAERSIFYYMSKYGEDRFIRAE